MEGYGIILEVWNGYTMWADNYIYESEQDALWELRLEICERDKELEAQNFQLAIDHRDTMYELWYQDQIDYKKQEVRNKVKLIMIQLFLVV